MTEPRQATSSGPQLLAEATRALTAAARPESGLDFAELVTLAVAAAVANVGGLDVALSRRDGSWEAARVRELLQSTVGEDPDTLLGHRTEPLIFDVYPDAILSDLGYWTLWDEAHAQLLQRYQALNLPAHTRHPDGSTAGELTPLTPEQEASTEAIAALEAKVDQLQEADIRAYGHALQTTIKAAVAELFPSLTAPVVVTVHEGWPSQATGPDGITWAVWERARAETPLPSSGLAPRDYPLGADLSDVDRDAGLSPLNRIAAQGRGSSASDNGQLG